MFLRVTANRQANSPAGTLSAFDRLITRMSPSESLAFDAEPVFRRTCLSVSSLLAWVSHLKLSTALFVGLPLP
jgi:hypothetical protein